MPDRINILYVIESLRREGAQRRLLDDLRYLARDKFSPVVCVLFKDGAHSYAEEISNLKIPLYYLNLRGMRSFARALAEMRTIIKKHKICIIHSQLFFADILSRLVKLFDARLKLVTTIQSSCYESNSNCLFSWKRLFVDRLTGNLFTNRFIVVSDCVAKMAKDNLKISPEKVVKIPNYIDESLFSLISEEEKYNFRKQLGINSSQKAIICVGRLDKGKGQHVLIQALALLREKYKNVVTFIAGDGCCEDELKKMVKAMGLADSVVFLGFRKDVPRVLAVADIFALPTFSEGFSIAILEAMISGKPCIASRIDSIEEIIDNGRNGILFEAGNSAILAQALMRLLDDEKFAAQLGSNARDTVLKNFTAKPMAAKLHELYLDCLNSKL